MTIRSLIPHFPGNVELHDPFTFPMMVSWEQSQMEIGRLRKDENATAAEVYKAAAAGILPCVKAWSLENFPEALTIDSFPASPRVAVAQLIAWLIGEINKVIVGDETIPPA